MRRSVFCLLLSLFLLALCACKNQEKTQGGLSKAVSENGISLRSGKSLALVLLEYLQVLCLVLDQFLLSQFLYTYQ